MKEITIVANWKMHKTKKEIKQWVNDFAAILGQISKDSLAGIKRETDDLKPITIILAPPLPYLNFLSLVMGRLHLSSILELASQNVSQFEEGNYTGEISAKQLKDLECLTIIIGHSERRKYFGETNAQIAQKAAQCLKYGLQPIVCVSKIPQVKGLKTILSSRYSLLPTSRLIIAYEPLFAIGTGQADTAENAQKMALEIKKILGEDSKVIYGGSVNSKNATEFLKQPDIEGLLVGTVGLDAKEFSRIIEQASLLLF